MIRENRWDPERANYYETILTVGNGRLGTRASIEERHTGALPGTFLAGVYDAFDAPVIDLVNLPDWLLTEVYVNDTRLDLDSVPVTSHERHLDLRTGLLTRETVFATESAGQVRLRTTRLASMANRDLCAMRVEVTPLDQPAAVSITTGLDAHRRNLERLPTYPQGTSFGPNRKWDKWARSTHLHETDRGFKDDVGYVEVTTIDSGIGVAEAFALSGTPPTTSRNRSRHEHLGVELDFHATAGETVRLDKLVGIATSRDVDAGGTPVQRAVSTAHDAGTFDQVVAASTEAWERLWKDSDLEIVGDPKAAQALRFSIYHLLIAANPDDPTVNIGAKSLSGEGYRGHVFWDTEIMMLPFYLFTQPRTARALLGYRHHTLPGARGVSAQNGTRGARYPWESADSGREECPHFTPDGLNQFFTRDEELHVTADVAYGIVRYAEVTGDIDSLFGEGAEVLFDTARYWTDRLEPDGDELTLRTVMGPDEFHSHVDDNAFTNRLVQWHLEQATAVYDRMKHRRPDAIASLTEMLDLNPGEPQAWADAAARLRAPSDPDAGVIEQFAGYFEREDVPIRVWDENNMPQYPEGYHHFNCEDTQLLKQPDVVMLMFVLPDEFSDRTRHDNYAFYEPRTLHKSSLSPSIHAIVGLQVGETDMADQYFARSAYVDLDDNQGNTEDGMHIASAAGTWQVVVHGFCGFHAADTGLRFRPNLPTAWDRVRFVVQWRGRRVRTDIGHRDATFELIGDGPPEPAEVWGRAVSLAPSEPTTVTP